MEEKPYTIRPGTTADVPEILRMWNELLPGEDHQQDIDRCFTEATKAVFVAEPNEKTGLLFGVIELGERSVAESCTTSPVAYVEGWFVTEEVRGQGIGAALMDAGIKWAREKGYKELGSDARIDNDGSIAAHTKLGFTEVDRVVCFKMDL